MIQKLVSDFFGIVRVAGWAIALRWLAAVVVNLPDALSTRNLMAADRAMGLGPFPVRHDGATAKLVGTSAFSGMREIWVRRVYSKDHFLKIPDNGLIVDLGANMGNFSALALATNRSARLIAVEPSYRHGQSFERTMQTNGFDGRYELCRGFVGSFTDKQLEVLAHDPAYSGAPAISEAEFLERYKIDHIDFLKCDIEGSEFDMLNPSSRLLDITDRIAIEIHEFGGDMRLFLSDLERRGFKIAEVRYSPGDCVALAARH